MTFFILLFFSYLRCNHKYNKMKKIYILVSTLFMIGASAQVGINTQTPAGTLDVNGNLFVRTTLASPVATAYDVLVVNPTTKEVQKVSTNLTSAVNPTIAKAEKANGFSLLTVGLFGGFTPVRFDTAEINNGSNFTVSTAPNIPSFYTVPSSGIYEIKYELRLGNGLKIEALNFSGTPGIAIIKNTSGTNSILDSRSFSGVNLLLLASINITNSTINNVYRLVQGDKISFGFNNGGIDLGLLSSSLASVNIKKISD